MSEPIHPTWQQAPAKPSLGERDVHIWRLDLAPASQQAMRDARPSARNLAHCARDRILAAYLGIDPHDLAYACREGGKPYLDLAQPCPVFNLSHCRDVGLLAVASTVAVGVDVEIVRQIDNPLRLARRIMSDDALSELSALDGDARVRRFFALWTQFEATQKALGHGIFGTRVESTAVHSHAFAVAADIYASLAVAPADRPIEISYYR